MPSPELTVDFDSRPPDDEGLVMAMLSSESDAIYSFQGMRRRLGLHQEKLTRILKRLEGDKLALKTDEGYRVLRSLRRTARNIMSEEPVIKGRLPPGVEPMAITSKLKGRWFKNFRWLGYASGQNTQTLYWITEDSKFQVGSNSRRWKS